MCGLDEVHIPSDWLNDYTFPAEAAFGDPAVAAATAEYFVQRMLAHGTTTASVFSTVHPQSVDAFMASAAKRNLRMLTGKVMMDRNAPATLVDTVADAERDCLALIERWHGKGRLGYTLTPRFAPTSTREQLQATGELFASRPDLHLQTHLAENRAEIDWVRQLFPERSSYLDVYAHYGLLGPRTIYGHCIHLAPEEIRDMAHTGSGAAFCPTSNLFLGSGLFNHAAALDAGIRVGLATDVGGVSSVVVHLETGVLVPADPEVGDVAITADILRSLGVAVDHDQAAGTITVEPHDGVTTRVPLSFSGLNRIPILLLGPPEAASRNCALANNAPGEATAAGTPNCAGWPTNHCSAGRSPGWTWIGSPARPPGRCNRKWSARRRGPAAAPVTAHCPGSPRRSTANAGSSKSRR